ncbi:hypothetical protein F442_09063 [Phytophthora nicotianae P10297]|uniref:Anthranilate synthase component I N-terminal domain-containing protein n=1 Tax=Phytophthora nicotianae P10297 TaxID=1317064 RepID=W2ZAN7_PHYNI|nr:hypothetical protein F442_09063 [Phytophthora nicotianae P10297]
MSFQPQMKRAAQLQQANPDKKLGSVYLDALADLDTPPIYKGQAFESDPLINLEQEMKNFRMETILGLNVPFTGGVVGYCGFDAILNFEPKIARNFDAQKDVLQVAKASTCSSTRSSSSSTSFTSSCT